MRNSKCAALFAVGLLSMGTQASAMDGVSAQATSVKGSVIVSHEGRVTSLAPNTVLSVGDRVISTNSGGAQIRFADGCSIPIGANAVTTVGAQSPCAASGLINTSSPMQSGDNWGTVALGFLAVGLITWAFFSVSDSENRPLSP